MQKIDKRLERSSKSTIGLRDLLRNICDSPASYKDNSDVISALKSQGALSKYTSEDLLIVPTSINTLKRVSDEYIEGGFQALDNLRKTALQRIDNYKERGNSSNKSTRAGLSKRVTELEDDVLKLEKINYTLLQTIADAMDDIKSVTNVEEKGARSHRSKQAIKRIAAMTSINPPPFDNVPSTSNVIPIKGG